MHILSSATVKIFDRVHANILSLNNSKFFAGIVMIMLNVLSKFVSVRLSDTAEEYLKMGITTQILIFSIAWMGTRDIYISLVLTAVFVVLSDHLFNEKSSYCIIPEQYRKLSSAADANRDGRLTQEEIDNAVKVLTRARQERQAQEQKENFALQSSMFCRL